uniref:Uncharacterized protein n=1 Tax=Anguilla anguilla TaxID=7936 RepID=A0A0E9RJ39_ANGAN
MHVHTHTHSHFFEMFTLHSI